MRRSISSVPRVDGVPAQKKPIVRPRLRSSDSRSGRVFATAPTSQGLPMKTQGPSAASIRSSASQGLAGA